MITTKSCVINANNYLVRGHRYLHIGDTLRYEFDGEEAEFLNRMLPLLKNSDFERICDLAEEFVALPF